MRKISGAADGPADTSGEPAQADSRCPGCGRAFACGAAGDSCWCMQSAARLRVPAEAGARCLCPDCLARRIGDSAT